MDVQVGDIKLRILERAHAFKLKENGKKDVQRKKK
jgi:hypothetical protein